MVRRDQPLNTPSLGRCCLDQHRPLLLCCVPIPMSQVHTCYRLTVSQQNLLSWLNLLLEALGVEEKERSLYDEFTSNITFKESHYQVMLQWKEYHEPLLYHYELGLKRVKKLLNAWSMILRSWMSIRSHNPELSCQESYWASFSEWTRKFGSLSPASLCNSL